MLIVHPVAKETDKILIQATIGLGETLVGGKITPD